MDWDERLDLMVRPHGKYYPIHCKLAAKVLDALSKELLKRQLGYVDDASWPFYIMVPDGKGRWVSLHCGGFTKLISIQQLTKSGTPDKRFEEVSFLSPQEAANYIERRYGKEGSSDD